ncbi:MAG: hypothetical protein LLG14_24825 [Nocardiaceae bacterium]|nr:hypothetical protein [Nocardiaceae bacterium]
MYKIHGRGPFRVVQYIDGRWILRRGLFGSQAAAEAEVERLVAEADTDSGDAA